MPRSSLLDKQWALYDEREYARAFAETRAVLERLPLSDRHDAHRLLGLARYALGQYLEAVHWFRELCEGSDVADDWCRLAMAATMHGDDELGAEAFAQVRICHQAARHGQHPGLYLHLYWYACALCDKGRYEAVWPLLDELALAYRRLHSTDSAFLFMHGMPFLSSVLSLVVECVRGEESHAAGVRWLEKLAKGLDEAGQRQVGNAMRGMVMSNE